MQRSFNAIRLSPARFLKRPPNTHTYHRIFTHQDNTLASQTLSDFMHLLRTDIIDSHNEDALELLEKSLELFEVSRLISGLAPHIFL
jgi:hypothetical protein